MMVINKRRAVPDTARVVLLRWGVALTAAGAVGPRYTETKVPEPAHPFALASLLSAPCSLLPAGRPSRCRHGRYSATGMTA